MTALTNLTIVAHLHGWAVGSVPVDPDAPEAQQLLLAELAKAEYQRARPSLFDQIVQGFFNWLGSLKPVTASGAPTLGFVVVAGVFIVALVILFLVYGIPRINRRSSVTGLLFGEDDVRSASQMRAAAESAAGKGDFATAIAEMFRAIARGLAERTVVTIFPGTTAHDFSIRASAVFPDSSAELVEAARSFDGVRYLGALGTREQYDGLTRLEKRLRTALPSFEGISA